VTEREAEFTGFFRAEFRSVVQTAYVILHDRQRSEDVSQEAFMQLFVHWPRVSRYERPSAWVRRVAIRLAIRSAKRERARPDLEREAAIETRSPGSPDLDLLRAIKALPPKQRAAVALFYFEDRPTVEIASILDCSESTATVHLHRARKRLAQLLGEGVADVP
jgi:RNA polymerase sigma-70 factor (ECF subfamily)